MDDFVKASSCKFSHLDEDFWCLYCECGERNDPHGGGMSACEGILCGFYKPKLRGANGSFGLSIKHVPPTLVHDDGSAEILGNPDEYPDTHPFGRRLRNKKIEN